jgi:hypothetical protein
MGKQMREGRGLLWNVWRQCGMTFHRCEEYAHSLHMPFIRHIDPPEPTRDEEAAAHLTDTWTR